MISVCVATFNGEKYIREQLTSILLQLSADDEVVVSDDSSTDNTLDIINELQDKRIRVLHHQKEKYRYPFDYTTHNIENAINHSRGDIIFLADQDDVWLPDKVKIIMSYLEQFDLVLSDCFVVDSDLMIQHPSYFALLDSKQGILHNIIKNSYLGCCMAFRRKIVEYALPFPKSMVAHDIWLGLIAEMRGDVYYLKTPTLLYRRHSLNVSSSSGRSPYDLRFKIIYRMKILWCLLKKKYLMS
ncbi:MULTISPECIES: glycosyltransferase family 2 protein [Bacteroides]|uniref:glycosyltransferase family 2 protein n=1 Tax=Bacteroides TaxID=816 RepID=UPI000E43DBAA|nr:MULTISPECIES: glycosyltransferase family 2 protein [Bacteroides]MBS7574003.1 glycosyltransferase family 2 protein [Bacteroides propionicigenes]RGM27798.1 glycosyltransferase family 2 protein [Bacteroides sp. OM08-17BH]HBO06465.1 alpha-L-Rha alpha-1,3-L-rhamnosyltransferase [Bacteroides sp.]